jgi:hypothetical protein
MPEPPTTIHELPDLGAAQSTDRIAVDRLGAAVSAGAFVLGQAYQIVTVGSTNFTAIGAAANTVGAYFVATGAGSGSGTAAPINTGDLSASAIAALATKATVGLANVDNTSDVNKPISTATQAALDGKASTGPIGSSGLTMTAGVLGRESGTGGPVVLTLSGLSIVNGVLTVTAAGSGTVTSVGLSFPTGFSVTGSPITTSGTLALSFAAGYGLPTTAKQTEWDTAYSERLRWDGGSAGLNAATGRTSLGLGTAAQAATGDFAPAAIADGIIFTISNRGETASPSTNYDESLPLSFALTVTKVTFITHIDNTGSSTTTLSAYKKTAAGTKTSVLSANATLASGASVAVGSLSGTAGALSLAAGDRLGVDLLGLGTGASGIKCIIEYTRSAI